MSTRKITVLLAAAALAVAAGLGSAIPYASEVTSVTPGPFAAGDTLAMIGAPTGAGLFDGTFDVYQLGVGGRVVLKLGQIMGDGPGTDLVVYENPFYVQGEFGTAWVECATVAVSSDGVTFARFPTSYSGPPGPFQVGGLFLGSLVTRYRGFAGVNPVSAHPASGGVDPKDIPFGGGDCFDLADLADHPDVLSGAVDLFSIRYVELVDVEAGVATDDAGVKVWDCGNPMFACADIDAVAAINTLVDAAGLNGRPWLDLRLEEHFGMSFIILELGDPQGLWTIVPGITASAFGFSVDFYANLLQYFVLLSVDDQSATLAAGPVPPDLMPIELRIGVVDPTGLRAGDALHLP